MSTMPLPPDGEVHLYCLELPQQPADLARLGRLLSASETARAGLLKSDQTTASYIAGRGILRTILSAYLDLKPEEVPLATGEYGKPVIATTANNICFNLSHSGGLLVVAVAVGLEVGIDIEKIASGKPLREMAKLVFSRQEQDELFRLPTRRMQTEAFHRCWVRKEACLKACGTGFSLPGTSFSIPACDTATFNGSVVYNHSAWQVLDIDVPHDYCAALAVAVGSPTPAPLKLVRVAMTELSNCSSSAIL